MKHRGLLLSTLCSLLLTTATLSYAGWFRTRSAHGPAADSVGQTAHDPYSSAAASRYRHTQPSHWRALMLQH